MTRARLRRRTDRIDWVAAGDEQRVDGPRRQPLRGLVVLQGLDDDGGAIHAQRFQDDLGGQRRSAAGRPDRDPPAAQAGRVGDLHAGAHHEVNRGAVRGPRCREGLQRPPGARRAGRRTPYMRHRRTRARRRRGLAEGTRRWPPSPHCPGRRCPSSGETRRTRAGKRLSERVEPRTRRACRQAEHLADRGRLRLGTPRDASGRQSSQQHAGSVSPTAQTPPRRAWHVRRLPPEAAPGQAQVAHHARYEPAKLSDLWGVCSGARPGTK